MKFFSLFKLCKSKGEVSMSTFEEIMQDVSDQTTLISSVHTMLDSYKAELDRLLSGVEVPPAVQEKIDALFMASAANEQALADAIVAHTPNEEPPMEEPPVEQPPVEEPPMEPPVEDPNNPNSTF